MTQSPHPALAFMSLTFLLICKQSLPFFLSHQGLLKKPGQKSLVQDVSACCDDVEPSFISLSLRFLVNENLDPKASLDLSSLFLAGTLCRCVAQLRRHLAIWLPGCQDEAVMHMGGGSLVPPPCSCRFPLSPARACGHHGIQVPCGLCLTALKSAGEGCLVIISFVIVFAHSHVQICDPIDYSMPGFSVLHHLPEFAQTLVQSVMPFNHFILSHPLLLLSSIFPSTRVSFSNKSALPIRWSKY